MTCFTTMRSAKHISESERVLMYRLYDDAIRKVYLGK